MKMKVFNYSELLFYEVPCYKIHTLAIWDFFSIFFNSSWANVMLRQSRIWVSRASPAQKSQGLRVFSSKNFSRATFFCFLGHLEDSSLNNLPLKKKRSVSIW